MVEPADKARMQAALAMLGDWERLDLEAAMSRLAPNAQFMADPNSAPVCGMEAIRTLWTYYMQLFASYACEVQHIAAAGPVVFVERIERITRQDGRKVVLPVATVFEVDEAGKITAWRDYWDPAMAAGPPEA